MGLRVLFECSLEYRHDRLGQEEDAQLSGYGIIQGTCSKTQDPSRDSFTDIKRASHNGSDVCCIYRVKSGVSQGCVLENTFFKTCIDWVMGETVEKTYCRISLGESRVTDLDSANDIVIFAENWISTCTPQTH